MRDKHIVRVHQQRYRREIFQRVVRQRFVEAGIDNDRRTRQIKRVAVRRRLRHHFGADIAAGAGPVVDDDLLVPRLGEFLSDQARHQINAAAGSKGDDEADRAGGVGLRIHDGRAGNRKQKYCNSAKHAIHVGFSSSIENYVIGDIAPSPSIPLPKGEGRKTLLPRGEGQG